jgi:putative Mg2+ transporter-C (MgtC) family protein
MIHDADVAVRILVAAAFGGLIGLEREWRDQPAGFRTHILVALGACLFTVVSGYGFQAFTGSTRAGIQADPTRIASQIVVGIGFLGGGTILRQGGSVRGLTTAASLWVTAAIGLSVGIGMYYAAGATTLLAFVCLAAFKPLERRFTRHRLRQPPDEREEG